MDAIRRLAGRYSVAVAAVMLATLAILAFSQTGQPAALALYVAAVIVSAWGGWQPVVLATGLSAVALLAFYFLSGPPDPEATQAFLLRWCLFLLMGGLSAYLSHLCVRAGMTLEHAYEVLSGFGDGLIFTDANGRIVYMNRRAEALTGWQRDTARDLPLEDVFRVLEGSATRPLAALVPQALRAAREAEAAGAGDMNCPALALDNETVLVNSSGTGMPIEGGLTPIRNANGTMVGVAVVFRDARRRRTLLCSLQQRIDHLDAIVRSLPAAALLFDRQGRCQQATDLAQSWVGCRGEECCGEGWTRRLDATDRDRIITDLLQALPAGQCYLNEMTVNDVAGPRRLRLRCTPYFGNDGVLLGHAAVLDDLTPIGRAAADCRQAEIRLAAERAELAAWRNQAELTLQQASRDFHRELARAAEKQAQIQQNLGEKLVKLESQAMALAEENQDLKTALAQEKAAAEEQARQAAKLQSQIDDLRQNALGELGKQLEAEQRERLRVQRDLDEALTLMEQSERQLRQERDRFKEILDAAPLRFTVKDSGGRVWYCNRAAAQQDADFKPPAAPNVADWTTAERRALETGQPVQSETIAGNLVEISCCFRVAAGKELGVATVSASYPVRVRDDEELKSRCQTLEAENRETQQHAAALERRCQRLETRCEFLEAIVEQHPDGLFVFDRECRFTLWNTAMARLTGKNPEEVLGQSAFAVFPNWAEGEEWECLVAAADGQQRTCTSGPPWLESAYGPLRGGDETPRGGIAAVRLLADPGGRMGLSQRPKYRREIVSMPPGPNTPGSAPGSATALAADDADWLSYN